MPFVSDIIKPKITCVSHLKGPGWINSMKKYLVEAETMGNKSFFFLSSFWVEIQTFAMCSPLYMKFYNDIVYSF